MHLESQLRDRRAKAALRPDYPIGCKRVLLSDDYYPTFDRPGVELVTTGVSRIGPDSILREDGTRKPVDTIIYATGFEASAFMAPMRIRGAKGKTLEQTWQDGAEAHLGMTVPDFPNFFFALGPNASGGN